MFMRRVALGVLVLGAVGFLLPAAASAQTGEAPSYEVYGGFAYTLIDAGLGPRDTGAIGAQGQFTFFVNEWFGIAGEVGYGTGELEIPGFDAIPIIDGDISVSQTTFLFGPRFRLLGTDRFRVGAQALVGAARTSIGLDDIFINLPEPFDLRTPGSPRRFRFPGGHLDETSLAMAFGVNFDLQVNDRISWRIIQPDILLTTFGNNTQTSFRFSTGVVFGF